MTQRALEPRHMRQLSTDLSLGITNEMPQWAATAWIGQAAALREIVGTVLEADPDGIDFSRLMSRLKVALGLRFSDQARAFLKSSRYEIVEFPLDLCFETLETHVPQLSHTQYSRHLGEETHFRVQEVAWDPRVKYMLISDTRNLDFESAQESFSKFADTIKRLTEEEAKAIIPNVAMASFLFNSVQWDKAGITVWTTDIPIAHRRYVVIPSKHMIYLSERDEDYRDDDIALLKVVVPVSC